MGEADDVITFLHGPPFSAEVPATALRADARYSSARVGATLTAAETACVAPRPCPTELERTNFKSGTTRLVSSLNTPVSPRTGGATEPVGIPEYYVDAPISTRVYEKASRSYSNTTSRGECDSGLYRHYESYLYVA